MERKESLLTLEQKVQRLIDLEEIKALKGKYLRCLDTKNWDGIRETFSPDIKTDYSGGKYSFDNPDAVVDFLRRSMPASVISHHQCHTPEIWFESDTLAGGLWYLQDYLLMPEQDMRLKGAAIYKDRYEKRNGVWLILETGYDRIFEERWHVKDHQIPINMHTKS